MRRLAPNKIVQFIILISSMLSPVLELFVRLNLPDLEVINDYQFNKNY